MSELMRVGDIIFIGTYSKARIVRESELKGYKWVIQLLYDYKTPSGAQRMAFKYFHVTERAVAEFKKV